MFDFFKSGKENPDIITEKNSFCRPINNGVLSFGKMIISYFHGLSKETSKMIKESRPFVSTEEFIVVSKKYSVQAGFVEIYLNQIII